MHREEVDVAVIGGGLAGVCAAIAAARHGCRVALIQDRPVLGGNASSEIRVPVTGACYGFAGCPNRHARETGIVDEIWMENVVRNIPFSHSVWDSIVMEWVWREKNINLWLNYRVNEVVMKDRATIAAVQAVPLVRETPLEVAAGTFIDASGDGWAAKMAGAEYRWGREGRDEFGESFAPEKPDRMTLGSSIYFTAHDTGQPVTFKPPQWARRFSEEDLRLRSHTNPLNQMSFWWIEYGGEGDVIEDADPIYRELLAIVYGVWDHIKNGGDHRAESYALDWIGKLPGRRESRRFMGDHILVQSDIEQQVLFDDRVSYGGWSIDLHPPGGIYDRDKSPSQHLYAKGTYSIPYRCLYSRNVDNLLFAGRHISVSHVAHGSTRVMRTLASVGQVAGTTAALGKRHNLRPRAVGQERVVELQQLLLADDHYIIGLGRRDPNDLALRARVTASSIWRPDPSDQAAREFGHFDFRPGNVVSGVARPELGRSSNLWVSDPLQPLPQTLTLEFPGRVELSRAEFLFDVDLDQLYFSGPVPQCVRDYAVEVRQEGRWVEVSRAEGNTQRRRVHEFSPVRTDALRLRVDATNEDPSARVYEVRAYGGTKE